jgi:hypothetical protein
MLKEAVEIYFKTSLRLYGGTEERATHVNLSFELGITGTCLSERFCYRNLYHAGWNSKLTLRSISSLIESRDALVLYKRVPRTSYWKLPVSWINRDQEQTDRGMGSVEVGVHSHLMSQYFIRARLLKDLLLRAGCGETGSYVFILEEKWTTFCQGLKNKFTSGFQGMVLHKNESSSYVTD